jgi:hypothetical protein
MATENQDPSLTPRYRRAFEAILSEIQSVPEKDFVGITVDIPATVLTVIGAWPEIKTLRPQFVQYLPGFEMQKFDKLEAYTLALGHSQTEYKTATEPPASLVALANSAIETRTVLLADLNSLIARGLIAPSATNELQGINGYKNVVFDLFALANILRLNTAKISGRSSVKPEELDAAENLADQLGTAVGERDQAPQIAAEAVRNRQAAFTLFIDAYEEVRTAINYLRRKQGDADTIAPSLYAGRTVSKKKPTDDANVTPPAPAPSPAVPVAHPPVTNVNPPAAQPNAPAAAQSSGPYV